MSNLINVSRALTLGATLLLSLAGCGNGSGGKSSDDGGYLPPVPGQSVTGTVSGRVADAQTGQALAGVEVKIGNLVASSDANGKYSLAGVPKGPQVVAQFSKAEYASNFATLEVNGSKDSVANRTLARVAVRTELSAAAGGVVTLAGSPAQVELPAAGLVSAGGAAYTGTVAVEMTPIDPGTNPLNMPGNYRAEGEAVPIESMGALQVELRDNAGAMLNLAPGKTATIRIPVPNGAASPPLTMPLYFFKESTGLWVREGVATLAGNAPRQYYEGTVSHFTVWNADQPMDTMYINGCVVNGSNQPRDASVSTDGLDYYGTTQVQTQPVGTFRIAARRNSRVMVSALAGGDVGSVSVSTGASDMTLASCIVLGNTLPVIVQQPANLNIGPDFTASLEVVAENAAQYTWYRNGIALTYDGRVLHLSGSPGVAGSYHVVVTNAHGSVTSATVTVTVGAPVGAPVIATQPRDLSVLTDSAATFTVEAQGDSLSYQWLRNGVEITGAQGPELVLGAVTMADNNALMTVRVKNAAGSVISANARLTVVAEAVMPSITAQPGNVSAAVGQNASFAVVASGTSPLGYQWLRNGVAIAGAVEATYQTPALTIADHATQFSVRVSNVKGTVTSNAAALTVSQFASVPGLHLSFMHGSPVSDQFAYGAVPVGGGTAVSLHPAGQGAVAATLMQGDISNGLASNFFMRSMVFWKNGALVRRDLSGPAGLPPEVRISNVTSAFLCDSTDSGDFADTGNDAVDVLRSWLIVHKQGQDGTCDTDDDQFLAVRANMSATDAPLQVNRPIAAIHSAQGALTGWLVRRGLQMQRVNADFSNPVALFTLPSDDATFLSGSDFSKTALFETADSVYAVDLTAAAPATLIRVATLVSEETVGQIKQVNEREIVVSIRGPGQTRLLRYTIASRATQAIGSVNGTGFNDIVATTPTRVVIRNNQGNLVSFPLAGGAPVEIPADTSFMSIFTHTGGERLWHEVNGSVISVNSDGSGTQTLVNSKLGGCVLKAQTPIYAAEPECDAVMVVTGASVSSYDAQTGAARVTYGNINLPAASQRSYYYFTSLTAWGQTGVLTQVLANADLSQATAVNYLLKTDQAGLTLVVMP